MADKIVQLIDNNGDNIYPVVQYETIPSITMTSTDPGEGSPLAANNFVAVYGGIPLNLDYSLTEQNTGTKWIDGRAIYKKTISCGTLPNATNKSIAHGVDNLSRVIDAHGYAFRSSDSAGFPLIFASDIAAANSIGFTWNSTTIVLGTGIDRSNITESYITIYYVKT